ncbi:MAG TPA: exodeoxyribonuclease VII small subunit [Candidatus Paceibacterota bacterium]|nr:exodeoxyribonuclease VII small subunit [Candidatus Paceibacterota bacterium]
MPKPKESQSFKHHLEEIAKILEWFDAQEELDVEVALEKVKKASTLIAASKKRLKELENEFKEIKKEAEEE